MEASQSESSMDQLSSIFADTPQVMGDGALINTCQALAGICDAPILIQNESLRGVSRSVTPSFLNSLGWKSRFCCCFRFGNRRAAFEKKNNVLRKKNEELVSESAKLRKKNEEVEAEFDVLRKKYEDLEAEFAVLRNKNTQLEIDSSSQQLKISNLENANKQLYEIYGLSDEATLLHSFPDPIDDDTLLERLNNSLNNTSNDRINSLPIDELRSKLQLLEIDHRSCLHMANKFKQFYHNSKKEIKLLQARNNNLIDDKYRITKQGAQSLADFHKILLDVQIERDRLVRENNVLVERENQVRSHLLVSNEDEFSWAAKVLDDARNNLSVDVSLHTEQTTLIKDILFEREESEGKLRQRIEELENEKKELAKNLSSCNEKCSRLKTQLKITVANFNNDIIGFRNDTIKMVFDDHKIPHSTYSCLLEEVTKNTPNLVISDSESEDSEDDEEYDEDEELEQSSDESIEK
ncbi:cAMP-inducible prespore protein D7-like [Papaver somniferum]|uniref:cAMP-inducible prespore protein D7-like n=1 Tax=Papaver somniferum TaxID=3469 RepID=UPI000E700DB8|nr:cAMP-inducible prespore protein D7-like [Papaver somniferum]